MKEFIEFIVRHLVDQPDAVNVAEVTGKHTIIYELQVGDGDLGKVIGRGGQTARSIRTLMAAAGAKMGMRPVLEILEGDRK